MMALQFNLIFFFILSLKYSLLIRIDSIFPLIEIYHKTCYEKLEGILLYLSTHSIPEFLYVYINNIIIWDKYFIYVNYYMHNLLYKNQQKKLIKRIKPNISLLLIILFLFLLISRRKSLWFTNLIASAMPP
jgi:hypothetical protein